MGYIYGHRVTAPLTTFTQSLREELYVQPYDAINWDKQRNNVAEVDLYMPHTKIMDVVNCTVLLEMFACITDIIFINRCFDLL